MLSNDRTIKVLLGVIAVLLAILVARPLIPVTSEAYAAQNNRTIALTNNDVSPLAAYRLNEVGTIAFPKSLNVREMQVIDSAQAFVVRVDDRILVYRVDKLNLGPQTPGRGNGGNGGTGNSGNVDGRGNNRGNGNGVDGR